MPRSVMIVSRALFVAALVLVTWFSLTPSPPASAGRWDKLAHMLAYVGLAFLLVLSVPRRGSWFLWIASLVLAVIAYGIIIEFIQTMTGRFSSSMPGLVTFRYRQSSFMLGSGLATVKIAEGS